jgi:hypothetical protein
VYQEHMDRNKRIAIPSAPRPDSRLKRLVAGRMSSSTTYAPRNGEIQPDLRGVGKGQSKIIFANLTGYGLRGPEKTPAVTTP